MPIEDLLPAFVSAWLHGPPSATLRAHDDVSREQHSSWRRRRQALLVQIGQGLGALSDPATALQKYMACLTLSAPSMPENSGHISTPKISGGAQVQHLAAAARQASLAEACVLRDLLLLSGLIIRTRAAGTLSLDGAQLSRLETVILPQLSHKLLKATMAYWLTSTLASSTYRMGAAGCADFSVDLPLQYLSLSGGYYRQSTGLISGSAGQQAKDRSLASNLVLSASPFLVDDGLGRQSDLDAAATRLVIWLQADNDYSGGSRRIIELGFSLFLQLEHRPLMTLARLAAGSSRSSGEPDLLAGLSLVCKLQTLASEGTPDGGREATVSAAAGSFLRAAASLSTGVLVFWTPYKTIAFPTSSEGDPHLLNTVSLAVVVKSLGQIVGEEVLEEQVSLLKSTFTMQLRFYEAIMMLFERQGAPEGASIFARAARQRLGGGGRQEGGVIDGVAVMGSESKLEGRLWASVFRYSCELGQFVDAHAAVLSNPETEQALNCLRRLVHELSEGKVGSDHLIGCAWLLTLSSLPLSGVITVEEHLGSRADSVHDHTQVSGIKVVPLIQEVIHALQRRAVNSDIATSPQPYRILHDFLMSRSDFKGATQTMLAYARRMRMEGHAAMTMEIINAYGNHNPD